jgi:hypothetical protein
MKKKSLHTKGMRYAIFFWCISAITAIAAMVCTAPTRADQSVSVTCYNLEKSQLSVGSVVVYDTSRAAQTCNAVYYDCKGRCVGCFSDSDFIDAVCADETGALFLK